MPEEKPKLCPFRPDLTCEDCRLYTGNMRSGEDPLLSMTVTRKKTGEVVAEPMCVFTATAILLVSRPQMQQVRIPYPPGQPGLDLGGGRLYPTR